MIGTENATLVNRSWYAAGNPRTVLPSHVLCSQCDAAQQPSTSNGANNRVGSQTPREVFLNFMNQRSIPLPHQWVVCTVSRKTSGSLPCPSCLATHHTQGPISCRPQSARNQYQAHLAPAAASGEPKSERLTRAGRPPPGAAPRAPGRRGTPPRRSGRASCPPAAPRARARRRGSRPRTGETPCTGRRARAPPTRLRCLRCRQTPRSAVATPRLLLLLLLLLPPLLLRPPARGVAEARATPVSQRVLHAPRWPPCREAAPGTRPIGAVERPGLLDLQSGGSLGPLRRCASSG